MTMLTPLLERIKRFAEERRRMLIEFLEAQNEEDTTVAKWKGYDADGYPIVQKGNKTETADGQGGISNRINSPLILDKSGSVEYPKKTSLDIPLYKKPPEPERAKPIFKKKSAPQTDTRANEFGIAIIRKQELEIDVICIAVIDENNATNTDSAWAAFRAAYPFRRFFLLQPNTQYPDDLYVPSAFSSDSNATHQIVSTTADWYNISGLNTEPEEAQCILFIDQSGSMTIQTVIDSYNSFKTKATARRNRVVVVDNASEDYIAPFYISDDTFKVDPYVSNWPQ